MKVLSTILCLILILSCKSDTKVASIVSPKKTDTVVPVSGKPGYPPLPSDIGMKIWNEGEMIDYLFHNLPFSMSQDEQASIQTNLTYIGEDQVDLIPTSCKPMARQFYQVGGDIIMESDVYFSDDCKFYVFLIDGKEKYSNQMNEAGQNFFANIIKQAMGARQNIQQTQ